MTIAGSQCRILGELLANLRPHWRRDAGLPSRIERLLGRIRGAGARDRRLYRELVYTALRYLPWIEPSLDGSPPGAAKLVAWLAADTPSTRNFRAAMAGDWPSCPRSAADKAAALGRLGLQVREADLLPIWLATECPDSGLPEHRDALLRRAPLWLRLQTDDPAPVLAEFDKRGWAWRRSPLQPGAVAFVGDVDAAKSDSYRRGLFEIQDIGSQMILEAVGIEPGGCWLDACAGAGGKTLQLARILGSGGRVHACDVRMGALDEMIRRAQRAGLAWRIDRPASLLERYDGVLVDAPCSGSGTWRRAPHLKWVSTPAAIEAFSRRQFALLCSCASRVRPGGLLVYATCSICRSENEDNVRRFLGARPEFAPAGWNDALSGQVRGNGLLFWPDAHDGDGFFAASLRRSA